jgi:hypothetical protein
MMAGFVSFSLRKADADGSSVKGNRLGHSLVMLMAGCLLMSLSSFIRSYAGGGIRAKAQRSLQAEPEGDVPGRVMETDRPQFA